MPSAGFLVKDNTRHDIEWKTPFAASAVFACVNDNCVSSSLNPFRKEWVNTPKRKLTHKKTSIVFFYLNDDSIRGRITGARSRKDFDTRIGSRLKIKTFLKKFLNETFEDDIWYRKRKWKKSKESRRIPTELLLKKGYFAYGTWLPVTFTIVRHIACRYSLPTNKSLKLEWVLLYRDWSRKHALLSQPITCKTITDHNLVARVFPRFRRFACFYFEFSLAL